MEAVEALRTETMGIPTGRVPGISFTTEIAHSLLDRPLFDIWYSDSSSKSPKSKYLGVFLLSSIFLIIIPLLKNNALL